MMRSSSTIRVNLADVAHAVSRTTARFRAARVAACVLVVLVALPRFDMNDAGVAAVTGDSVTRDSSGVHGMTSPDVRQYSAMVQMFRGELPAEPPAAPFCYRPLTPYLASVLPVPALTAIDVIDLVMLVLCILFLDAFLVCRGMQPHERVAGMFMFALSFPVFYYGATGRIDAGGVACMLLILASHARGGMGLLMASVFIAPFAKETTVLAVGMCVLLETFERRPHAVRNSGGMMLMFVAGSLTARMIAPAVSTHVWNPSVADTLTNLVRPRAYLSSILSFGVPGVLAMWHVMTTRRAMRPPFERALILTSLGCAGVWAYSFVAAYTDGRFVWIAYPFLIPLALMSFRRHDSRSTTR
ncbi:MAG: hypothetical protein ACKO9V_02725 [Candidatus Kapaibacterium sp.]